MSNGQGTINSATPQIDLMTAIEAAMTAHDNWTLVDTAVIATATYRVWKNHGTGVTLNNSFGQDFYVVIAYTTTGAGNISIRACEDVTLASDLMIRPCMEDASNPTLADASGIASTSYSTAAGVMTFNATPAIAPNTSTYYFILTRNGLHLGLRRSDSATLYSVYVGLFESRVTIANEFPLLMIANTQANTNISVSNAFGGTSRHPGRISQAANTSNFMHNLAAMTLTVGDTGNVDLFRGMPQAAKLVVQAVAGSASIANQPLFGRIRGLMYETVFLPPAAGVALTMGDVLDDIADEDYWHFGYSGLAGCWVNSAAV